MTSKPCQPECQCGKHYLTPEHREHMSVSVSAAMKRYWQRRKNGDYMKCPSNCRCGKHEQRLVDKNTTIAEGREHISSTYGDQQRERQNRMFAERKTAGLVWRGTPSEQFDWDSAIQRLYLVFDQVYGKRWRR